MSKTVSYNGKKMSIANMAMLIFAKEYAELNGYLEGWVRPDDFWGNKYDRIKNPEAPEVIPVSYVLPMFDTDKEEKYYWDIPRVKIDNFWGKPRINVVDREENFCCLAYDRETNSFTEAQVWKKNGFDLALSVKAQLERIIIRLEVEYGTGEV